VVVSDAAPIFVARAAHGLSYCVLGCVLAGSAPRRLVPECWGRLLERSSDTGVIGVIGLRSRLDVSVLLRKLLSMVLNSLSGSESAMEEDEDSLPILRMSGAFRAWTLVVLISLVGREIWVRLMVPGA